MFTLPRVVRGKSDFAPIFFLSLVENISDENIPYWIRTSFLGRKVINFLLLLFTVAKCSERRENVDVRCWLIIGMIKTTQREIKDTRT